MRTKVCLYCGGKPQPIERFIDSRDREMTGCETCRSKGKGRGRQKQVKPEPFVPEQIPAWQIASLNRRIIEITRGGVK